MKKSKWSKINSILLISFIILTVVLLFFIGFNNNNSNLMFKFAIFYTLLSLLVGGIMLINPLLNITKTEDFSIKKRVLRFITSFICFTLVFIVIRYFKHEHIFNMELITKNLFLAFLFTFSDLFFSSDKKTKSL